MVLLEPSDLLLFQNYIKKDLYLLFQADQTLLLPANCAPGLLTTLITENKMKDVLSNSVPVVDRNAKLVFLPLIWQNKPLGMAILEDAVGTFNEDVWSDQWPKISPLILEKVQAYKAYFTDESGALNQALFRNTLIDLINVHQDASHRFSIIFMELLPEPSLSDSGRQPLKYRFTQDLRTGNQNDLWVTITSAIKNKLKDVDFWYLFHITSSISAIIMPGCDTDKGRHTSLTLFEFIKKSRFLLANAKRPKEDNQFKLAMGFLCYPNPPIPPLGKGGLGGLSDEEHRNLSPEELCEQLIEKGMETLAVAKSRPDYPYCLSRELDETVSLKMVKNIHPAIDKLRKKWKKARKFCLILVKYDAPESPLWKKIGSWLSPGQSIIPCARDSFFLYLPEVNPKDALLVGKNLQYQIKKGCDQTVSMGLASYPMLQYKKEEIPFGAYKALVHTGFFGPDSITAFDAVSLNISGDMLFNAGHIPGAIMEYKKGLSLHQQDINLLNSLGVCYAELKWYKRAISCFEKALAIEKNSLMAQYNLGSVYIKAGMPDKALSVLEQAASLNGDHFDIFFQLGKLLQEQRRWTEAINYFQKATRCPDAKGYVYRYLGESYLALNSKKDAMAAFKKAVKLNPADPLSFSRLGILYAELKNDLEIAQALCQKALELDSQNSLYWKTMGQVYYLKNDYPQAIRCLKEAQQRLKKDHEIYYHLGLIYKKMGQIPEAGEEWQKALKIEPLFEEVQAALQSINAIEK